MKLILVFVILFTVGTKGQTYNPYKYVRPIGIGVGDPVDDRRTYFDTVSFKYRRMHWFPGMEKTKGYQAACDAMDSIYNSMYARLKKYKHS